MLLLNELEALQVVILFLKQHYEKTKPDDSGTLAYELSKFNTCTNKYSLVQEHWIESLEHIKCSAINTQNHPIFTEEQVFETMILFFEKYYQQTKSDDIGLLLSTLLHGDYGATSDPAAWYIWQECLGKVKEKSR